jgi:hypothetical protein
MSDVTTVFSVCTIRDIDVWSWASRGIVEYIKASNYVVLVPDPEVEEFVRRSPDVFQVLPESRYLAPIEPFLKPFIVHAGSGVRRGWYLQQFLKLSYLESIANQELIVIWDADTVPLQPLRFTGSMGEVVYFAGKESHAPYFDAITRLLGMQKIVDFSFIAQCFALRGSWAREFFYYIETHQVSGWVDATLKSIDWQEPSGFSEYETLGTFISHRYPNDWRRVTIPWQRYGRGLVGNPSNLHTPFARRQLQEFAFASFENWDRPFGAQPRLLRWWLRCFYALKQVMLRSH